jgi:hypothetical protein
MDRFCFGFAFEPHIWRSHKYHLGYEAFQRWVQGFKDTDEIREPGLLTSGFCTLCIAASLAEFLSAYPTFVSPHPISNSINNPLLGSGKNIKEAS